MEEHLSLRYQGAKIVNGMDAHEAASAITGFANFTRLIGKSQFGADTPVSFKIESFQQGSAILKFVVSVIETTAPLVASMPDLAKLIPECVELLKHLGGHPPAKTKTTNGGAVSVENNNGSILNVSAESINLVLDQNLGRDAGHFLGVPLSGSAEKAEIYVGKNRVAEASKIDAGAFRSVSPGETLTENISELYLKIVTVHLEGDAKWRFSDGTRNIVARIQDQNFLNKVRAGREGFRSGDTLKVVLRAIQTRASGKLKADYIVEKVLEHFSESRQQQLL